MIKIKYKEPENSSKIKGIRRQKKKEIRMKVSGRSVIQLKKVIESKSENKKRK